MSRTMDAYNLIALSICENRTVTEYPDTREEWDAIHGDLLAECEDSVEESGAGHSEPEARGWTDYWGRDDNGTWRVSLVNPPR